jgi:hypothetical protein
MSPKRLIMIGLLCAARPVLAERPPPSLGTAASFAVLAPSVTSSGSTIVTGNLGGNTITGFPPGVVLLGTTLHDIADPLRDASAAYEDLRNRTCEQTLQGDGLAPHVYCSVTPFTLQGTLTLDAHNDPNAFWIFQLGAGLTTAPKAAVRVINGGWEGNVFWQVNGQAAIGDSTAFVGNVLASKGIAFSAGASLSGRALVLGGGVILSNNNVSLCCKQINVVNPTNSLATAGTLFTAVFTQTGATAPFAFALASGTLPTGIDLAANGTLSGKTAQPGKFPITVRVTDATNCTGTSATYVLVVCAPITVIAPTNTIGTVGVPFDEQFGQMGAIGTATFSLAGGALPPGLILSPQGRLYGITNKIGCVTITVMVTDDNGCTGTVQYKLCFCQTITVILATNANGTAGVPFSAQFTQTGAIGTARFTLAAGTLPPGLVLSTTGQLNGTTNQIGCFTITVTVTDDNFCTGTSLPYIVCIKCQTITVIPPVTNTGTSGAFFCVGFKATGILGTATFSSSDPLPIGLTLTNVGMLCGTPTQTGCFTITVTVTDTNGCTGMVKYTFCICTPPIFCPAVEGSPTIAPPAVNGVPYLQTITVSGGTSPYTFTVIGGTLPPGLGLNSATGVISGTPTVSAPIDVVIRITDAAGCSGVLFYYPATIPALSQGALTVLFMIFSMLGVALLRKGNL